MIISDFSYHLPENLIAQRPLEDRSASRMMIVNRALATISDSRFVELPGLLRGGDIFVLNNTKVFPARLIGSSETGAVIEIFLISEIAPKTWAALARPGRRLRPGKKLAFGTNLSAEIVDKMDDGKVAIRFLYDGDWGIVLEQTGKTPLPPYIKRYADSDDLDRRRYQTVFAKNRGAIAAPTAGLHLTTKVLETIRDSGVTVVEITLHVGYGTFEPVRVDDLANHVVSAESYSIDEATSEILNTAKSDGRRIVAVGTTTTRALESNWATFEMFAAGQHSADLTITPGYKFLAIDALLTNFHLPQSSLLVLTSTFGGHDLIMKAYRHAVAERYRFYSYGDCMFIS